MTMSTHSAAAPAFKRPRLLLADDHKLVLDGLRRMLESDYDIVGTVGDGQRLLSEAERLRPDIILSEVALPLLDGIEAVTHLRQILPEVRVIFVTMRSGGTCALSALRAGGAGYVLKQCSCSELRVALSEVLEGRVYVTPLLKKPEAADDPSTRAPRGSMLTHREREVLQLVALGHSARTIAAILRMSTKTVAFHKTNIRQKLEIHTTAELTKYALLNGVIS